MPIWKSGGSGGSSGQDGADGASAYDLAVSQGFVGTLSEWLDSLVGSDGQDGSPGADGAKGDKGDQGIPGNNGSDGSQGIQGNPGADGFSIEPVMLNCLTRTASTIPSSQAHNGTHKVAYSAPAVGGTPSWLSLSGDGFTITLTEDGIYEVAHNTFVRTTAGARSGATARIAVDDVVEGARPATGYVRFSNGHNECSTHITGHLIQRNGTDKEITIPLGNETTIAATNASMSAGESTLTIKKLT